MKMLDMYFLAYGHISLFDAVLCIKKDSQDIIFNL